MDELVRISKVKVLSNQRLRLTYVDGLVGDVTFEDGHWHGVLAPLAEPEFFSRVFVGPETGTLTWPGELDIAPEPLRESARENLITPATSVKPPDRDPDLPIRVLYRSDGGSWFAESPDIAHWTTFGDSFEDVRELALESVPFALACEAEDRGEGFDEDRYADVTIEHFVLDPAGAPR
jgi:predicted RNase H-like HicB family nuclease